MDKKPIYFYMANLWSEAEKIFVGQQYGDKEMVRNALARATPIFEKIKSFKNPSATAEVKILQDILIDLAHSQNKYNIRREELASYLQPFAMRVFQGAQHR